MNGPFKMKGFPVHDTSALKQSTDNKSKKPPVNTLENALVGTDDITKGQFNRALNNFKKENPGGNPVFEYNLLKKYLKNEGVANPPDSINVMRAKKKTT